MAAGGGVSGLVWAIRRWRSWVIPGLAWFPGRAGVTLFARFTLFPWFTGLGGVGLWGGFWGVLIRELIGGFGFLGSGFHRGRGIIILVIRVGRTSRLAVGGLLQAYGFVGFETGALSLVGEAGFVLHVKIVAL
jgi:hypothetical protein